MIARITVSLLLLLTALTGYSQNSDVSTLLTQKDEMWIQERGFPLNDYDWSNEEVNLNLELAAKYRKQSNKFWAYGGAGYLIGGIIGTAGAIIYIGDAFGGNDPQPNAALIIGTTMAYSGMIAALGGGIWKKAKARHRVRDAIRLKQ